MFALSFWKKAVPKKRLKLFCSPFFSKKKEKVLADENYSRRTQKRKDETFFPPLDNFFVGPKFAEQIDHTKVLFFPSIHLSKRGISIRAAAGPSFQKEAENNP